jgi:L-fuculose-phosphate aldolase
MNIHLLKKEMIKIGNMLHQKDFVAANDGNISYKINDNLFLTTPTGVSKGLMKENMLILVDNTGKIINGKFKPSSEIKMHLEVYKKRTDVVAIVHAHPVFATAFAVANIPLALNILPEIIVNLGSVPVAPYATPSTDEVPNSITNLIEESDALLLANHGVLTTGKNLIDAYYKMEQIEHYAKILFYARQIGNINILKETDLDKLKKVKENLGIKSKTFECSENKLCSSSLEKLKTDINIDYNKITQIISEEVKKQLKS